MSKKVKKKLKSRRLGKNFSIRSSKGFPIDDVNAFESTGEYLFWLTHGLNYLHSDFESAVWRPLYDIYEGKTPQIEEIRIKLVSTFSKDEEWTPIGKVLGVWASQGPGEIYSVYRNILHTVKRSLKGPIKEEELEDLVRGPYFGPVWGIFHEMKERSLLILN